MALLNATLNLKLDRKRGVFEVLSTSTRVYSQDENVSLNVGGWTLDEVTKTAGKTPYEPYFRIVNCDGEVLAECKLSPDATPVPEEPGGSTYAMRGALSTNTDKMVAAFSSGGYQPGWQYDFNALIFSTSSANPIATGSLFIWAFDEGSGTVPSNLPSAGDVWNALDAKIDGHIANVGNPHGVTAAQVNAYTKSQADGLFATNAAMGELTTAIASANAAISALQSALQTANLAIASNTVALTGKADVQSTYRKDETYCKNEVNEIIVRNRANYLLTGKVLKTPENDRERNALLAFLVRELGGTISENGAEPLTPPTAIAIKANDGTTRSIISVKSGNEYTTEVI